MEESSALTKEKYPDPHHDIYSKTIFGFWVYLLTDFLLFATFFAAYAVLRNNTFGGPALKDLVDISFTFIQTLILLCASFISGLAGSFVHRRNKSATIVLFLITFVLGFVFLWMEGMEFSSFMSRGSSWQANAFASAFFVLVGSHLLHVVFGLIWTIVLLIPLFYQEFSSVHTRRLTCLRMFWQFVNIIWVFTFSIVYLLGVV